MDKENVLGFLDKFDYDYRVYHNQVIVKLELAHEVTIVFNEDGKLIIKDKLVGWNFLTGIIEMSLKNAYIYSFIGLAVFGFIYLSTSMMVNVFNILALYLLSIFWILLFSIFYTVRLEAFKNRLISWIKE